MNFASSLGLIFSAFFFLLPELGAGIRTGETTTATVRGTWEDYECQINVNYKLPIKEAIKTGSTGQKK